MSFSTRVGCSTISFRHLPLTPALEVINELGFAEIDLGALPGVCDHVPYVLDSAAVAQVAAEVAASGLTVRSVGERGGLEVSSVRVAFGDRSLDALMYRSRDGKVQEYLLFRP